MEIKDIKEQIRNLEIKARNLKTKKAKQKVFDIIETLRRDLSHKYQEIADKHDGVHSKGVVRTVSKSKGEFTIQDPTYGIIFAYESNCVGRCTWYPETACVDVEVGQELEYTIVADGHYDGIQIDAKDIKGGKQNLEKFNKLNKDKKLAFVCLPGQETGLFSKE